MNEDQKNVIHEKMNELENGIKQNISHISYCLNRIKDYEKEIEKYKKHSIDAQQQLNALINDDIKPQAWWKRIWKK